MAGLNETRMVSGFIGDSIAVRASLGSRSAMHEQHGTGVLIGLESTVAIWEGNSAPVRARVVIAPPHVVHAAASPGPTVGLLFDPELEPAVAAFARSRRQTFALEGPIAEKIVDVARAQRASLGSREALGSIAHDVRSLVAREGPAPRRLDRHVGAALEALRNGEQVSARGVSGAHLRALFKKDVGVSMRTYRLWWRLMRAVSQGNRVDFTTAAHASGFSDLAHFSRTCRRLLGYSPTTLRDELPHPRAG